MLVEYELRLFAQEIRMEEIKNLLPACTRLSKDGDGTYRLFWLVPSYTGEVFEDGLRVATQWVRDLLRPICFVRELDPTLWCLVHSEKEFFGLAMENSLIQNMAEDHLCLVISVYTDIQSSSED